MKLLELMENEYLIFMTNIYTSDVNFQEEKSLEIFFKIVILNIKKKYDIELYEFYEVSVFYNNKVRSLFKIVKIDEYSLYNKTVDLKIIICLDCPFYFKTKNYEVLNNYRNVYFYNDYFYININD